MAGEWERRRLRGRRQRSSTSRRRTPSWLRGYESTGGSLRFRAEAGHLYLAVSQQALLTPRVVQPAASTLRATANQADYLLIAPRAFLEAAEPLVKRRLDQGLAGACRRLRGDRGRVRARPAVRGGDPELPRVRLPVLGAAVAALRAAAGRLDLRPAELHGHVAAVPVAGAVDEDDLPLDRLRSAARRGERRGRASGPGDRATAGHYGGAGAAARREAAGLGRLGPGSGGRSRRSWPTTRTWRATSRRTRRTSERASWPRARCSC